MSPEARRKEGQRTAAEAALKGELETEKEIHNKVKLELMRNGIGWVETAMNKKSTIAPGHPDFTCWKNGFIFFLEIKTEHGRLSTEQIDRHADIERSGCTVFVTYGELAAINAIHDFLDRIGSRAPVST